MSRQHDKSPVISSAASTDWELDVWGRLRRTLENARASAQASAADLANAKLSARSQLAIAYLQLRGADAQRKLLSDTEVGLCAHLDHHAKQVQGRRLRPHRCAAGAIPAVLGAGSGTVRNPAT